MAGGVEGAAQARRDQLGQFLRTRRGRLSPAEVGLPPGVRRRTPGLRREEVALLIGVSPTWYTWLEQGRAIQVSAEVLANLARILRLLPDERTHLFTLAGRMLPGEVPALQEPISAALRALLVALEPYPAHIRDEHWDVLAWNGAEALITDWATLPPAERNVIVNHFANPWLRRISVEWERDGQVLLALFRMDHGRAADDRRFAELLADLEARSPEFRRWWPQHEVQSARDEPLIYDHPEVGPLPLARLTLVPEPERRLTIRVLVPASEPGDTTRLRRFLAVAGTPSDLR